LKHEITIDGSSLQTGDKDVALEFVKVISKREKYKPSPDIIPVSPPWTPSPFYLDTYVPSIGPTCTYGSAQ